jgi:hypothetical protein
MAFLRGISTPHGNEVCQRALEVCGFDVHYAAQARLSLPALLVFDEWREEEAESAPASRPFAASGSSGSHGYIHVPAFRGRSGRPQGGALINHG